VVGDDAPLRFDSDVESDDRRAEGARQERWEQQRHGGGSGGGKRPRIYSRSDQEADEEDEEESGFVVDDNAPEEELRRGRLEAKRLRGAARAGGALIRREGEGGGWRGETGGTQRLQSLQPVGRSSQQQQQRRTEAQGQPRGSGGAAGPSATDRLPGQQGRDPHRQQQQQQQHSNLDPDQQQPGKTKKKPKKISELQREAQNLGFWGWESE